MVPTAAIPVKFKVAGAGRLIGVGNGNPTSIESDKGQQRLTFNGLCQAVGQSDPRSGATRLTNAAPALASANVTIVTQ
ncbi:hypothetical protein U1872_10020 [Sphingomonas sp. RB3P16]|uniref:hypothetical protein n=1 Tax=Parasphingomonas frigoris TaxID=3096163 RepID=UPI002FC9814C